MKAACGRRPYQGLSSRVDSTVLRRERRRWPRPQQLSAPSSGRPIRRASAPIGRASPTPGSEWVSQRDPSRPGATITGLVDNDRSLLIDLAEQRGSKQGTLTECEPRDRELLCDRYERTMGTLPSELTFTIERHGFDWTSSRLREYHRVPTAPVQLAALCQEHR